MIGRRPAGGPGRPRSPDPAGDAAHFGGQPPWPSR